MFLGGLGTTELILILLVVLLLFGAKKIPDLARGMGRGIREFKDASREIKREIETEPTDANKSRPQE
jgi:sec-independent protein translocase protein TatA